MNLRDNLWWIVFAFLWVVEAVFGIVLGDILLTAIAVTGVAITLLTARIAHIQRQRIRILKVTITELERQLKDFRRYDRRR
jgi:hypothetical protein